MLLSGGRLVFLGPRGEVGPFFAGLGLRPPPTKTEPDFLQVSGGWERGKGERTVKRPAGWMCFCNMESVVIRWQLSSAARRDIRQSELSIWR